MCLECDTDSEKKELTCAICEQKKPLEAFSGSMKVHISQRTIKCIDCSHPPCMFAPNCETCTVCRNTRCRKSGQKTKCTDEIQLLRAGQVPQTEDEVRNFACPRCKYVRCIHRFFANTVCGKVRPEWERAWARKNKMHFLCKEHCQS